MNHAAPFQLQQIDHVVLRVRDVAAMQAFYCDVLGCTVERRQDAIGLLQLRAGSSLIDLVRSTASSGAWAARRRAPRVATWITCACARSRSIATAIVAHLQAHGVRIGEFGSRYGARRRGAVAVPVRSGRQPGRTEGAAGRSAP